MTLKDILFVMSGALTSLDTNNETFPKIYRHDYIHYSDFYVEIIKSAADILLDREIENISIENGVPSNTIENYMTKGIADIAVIYPNNNFSTRPRIKISLKQ